MNKLVKELAYLRTVTSKHKTEVTEIEKEIQEVIEKRYGKLLAKKKGYLASAQAEEKEVYEKLRAEGVDAFMDTGEKKPHAAVTIGEYTVCDYDTAEAVEFCVETKATNALKLDTRKFKKLAEVLEPDFVKIYTEARARVASDLSEYLEDK